MRAKRDDFASGNGGNRAEGRGTIAECGVANADYGMLEPTDVALLLQVGL